MGTKLHFRRDELLVAPPFAVFGVGQIPPVPVGKAEVQPGRGGAIEFVRRLIVPHPVTAVVGEPELPGPGMPVEPDRVAHPAGKYLQVAPIREHAHDRGKARILLLADVAWSSHRNVEPAVRPEADELPAVMTLVRKRVVDRYRLGRVIEPLFDVVKADHAADLGDVEGAIAESHPVGRFQAAGNDDHFVCLVVAVVVYKGVDLALATAT